MAISLEIPKKLQALQSQANQVANEVLRPISRKYDLAEHAYPKELDMLAALIDGMNDSGAATGAGVIHPVDQRCEHVELLGVGVLGEVVLARDRAQNLARDLVRLLLDQLQLLRELK